MSRRHPAIVWMAAEYARCVGGADRAANSLATNPVLVERTSRMAKEFRKAVRQLPDGCLDESRISRCSVVAFHRPIRSL
jgi:hypothetical protein